MGPDAKCLELAEHILRSYPADMRARAIDLAYALQATAEKWLDDEKGDAEPNGAAMADSVALVTYAETHAEEPGFRVGDRVEYAGVPSKCINEPLNPGCLGTVVSVTSDSLRRVLWDGIPNPAYHDGWLADVGSLRLATPAASEEFYGTQPKDDELPAELGYGARSVTGSVLSGYKLDRSGIATSGPCYRRTQYVATLDWVDWASVKRPPPQPVPAAKTYSCHCCGAAVYKEPGLCIECNDRLEAKYGKPAEQPRQTHPSEAWGIPRAEEAARRAPTTCNEPGCNCPYCRHRPFSPIMGASDQRYHGGKGPAHSTLDESISQSRRERDGAEVGKHPNAWPEGSGDEQELYST